MYSYICDVSPTPLCGIREFVLSSYDNADTILTAGILPTDCEGARQSQVSMQSLWKLSDHYTNKKRLQVLPLPKMPGGWNDA